VTSQINFTSRVESPHYTNCLNTFNRAVLLNLTEIRENAVQTFIDEVEDEEMGNKDEKANQRTMNMTMNKLEQVNEKKRTEAKRQAGLKLKSALKNLAMTVEHVGIVNPFKKVYELSNKLDCMAEFFAILTMHCLNKELGHSTKLNTLHKKNN